jgi:OPA family glycerol-3-phosphate transporter-like MFS transporter
MEPIISKRGKAIAWLLTLVYFASYLMRKNFDIMLARICSDFVSSGAYSTIEAAEKSVAIVSMIMTVTYGAGQIICGIIGDKIKPQTMLTCGLSLAAICNIAMFFCPSVPFMVAVWGINGFAHSMLWPPIVRLMSTYLNDTEYGYSSVRVSWGSSIATILLYLLCPVALGFMSWRTIILLCSVGGIGVLIFWIVYKNRLFTSDCIPISVTSRSDTPSEKKKTSRLPLYVFIPLALIMLSILLQGALRDGVTNWTPSILSQTYGLPEESAIFYTVVPSILSMISFYVFDILYRRVFKSEIVCASVIFIFSAICSFILYVSNIFFPSVIVAVISVSLIIACMHGVNFMLITVVPKRFIRFGKVSTFSGLLNAWTYVGASIATPGFALLKEASAGSWNTGILVWGIISMLGSAVCIASFPLWRKFCK